MSRLSASTWPLLRVVSLVVSLVCAAGGVVGAESAAGVRWTAPTAWKNTGSTQMRAATYAVPPAAGDSHPAECVVYFFGAGQGGPVDLNIQRWQEQFTDGAGRPAQARVNHPVINGMKTTTLDASGNYSGLGGPTGPAHTVPGYRVLAAIIEGPGGNIFVKFTGPQATVAAQQGAFAQMLGSFKVEGK